MDKPTEMDELETLEKLMNTFSGFEEQERVKARESAARVETWAQAQRWMNFEIKRLKGEDVA